ncbi:hypothetical protein G647_08531 [Cladophialophora carrionii CBS 160.54]|uniref:G domain-containing protein n=1 Tax=Cladophialophora carrionii CBS 160.54 TaxID=1279043 RepID=V9D0P5_9EURO|nr:uncharacterized protein G647_08531 [Cladophialophora carrionii CBS 160.54]ETI20494.1 hypothetical protein G647_08531 [Cladophialophora carrionii CBS 160.54]
MNLSRARKLMRSLYSPKALWRVQARAYPRGLITPRIRSSARSLVSVATAELERPRSESKPLHPLPADSHLQEPLHAVPSTSSPRGITPDSKFLPLACPGCGALTQDVDPGLSGYYTLSRRAVRKYVRRLKREERADEGEDSGEGADTEEAGRQVPIQTEDQDSRHHEHTIADAEDPLTTPFCDRCHYLVHDCRGVPIAHPSIEAIADSIAESPFTRNHVYHVVDAADFPMSVIPSIYKHLSLANPRTQNRRSQHSFSSRPSLSFLITRSDLIAPTKEMVDSMMPKFVAILRTALGRMGRNLRLGNVHLVSSKRGWWTKDIKETIWNRGGGNWLVGKFNVGKSNLFEVLFPKGAHNQAPFHAGLQQQKGIDAAGHRSDTFLSEKNLLPPPQPQVAFPTMPLVSSLPGTTASPIRIPFGNHKGELIDTPGLQRGGLDQFVKPEDRADLVMVHRPTVAQHVLKPGQSLLLGGGLVRITPLLNEHDRSTTMLAYPFVPLKAHVTSTAKAEGTQIQQRESGIESILAEEAGMSISSAGRFALRTDVTRSRAGSMIRAGVKPDKLPFHVYATDILIEGVGWVELVCQVRKSKQTARADGPPGSPAESDTIAPTAEGLSIETSTFTPFGGEQPAYNQTSLSHSDLPEVEIFTPGGKFIGQRTCLDLWQMWNTGKPQKTTRSARPRKPMAGAKKRDKIARRAALKH